MGRFELSETVEKQAGFSVDGEHPLVPAVGAEVYVYDRLDLPTLTELAFYTTESGGTPAEQPFTTDTSGRVVSTETGEPPWLDFPPAMYRLIATLGASTWTKDGEAVSAADVGGREEDFAEAQSSQAATTVFPSVTDVPGLTIDVEGDDETAYILRFWCTLLRHSADGARALMHIYEGSTEIAEGAVDAPGASKGATCTALRRLVPTSGTHTYKGSVSVAASGTATMNAGSVGRALLEATRR